MRNGSKTKNVDIYNGEEQMKKRKFKLYNPLALVLALALLVTELSIAPPTQTQAATAKKTFVIVLDPGHDTTHARSKAKNSGIVEGTMNYEIATALKGKLEAKGFTVVLTRGKDCPCKGSSVSQCLEYRTNLAKAVGCDLFISIHCNASGANNTAWRSANGSSIYITSYKNYKSSMVSLATAISSRLKSQCGLAERTPKGTTKVSQAGQTYTNGDLADYYKVIRESTYQGFPSLLIEHGFMDNKHDSDIMKKMGGSGLAKADCDAIVEWYKATYGSLPDSGTVAYVNNETLNLRQEASAKSKVVVTLKQKDPLVISGSTKDWYQVTAKRGSKTYTGWVSAQYVQKGTPKVTYGSASPSSGSGSSTSAKGQAGYVNYSYLNLRKSSSTSSAIVCKLAQNDSLTLYELNSGWYRVDATHQGKKYSGYVSSKYVAKGSAPGSKNESSSSGGSESKNAYVSYEFLNLRKKADTKSDIVVKLSRFDSLTITETNGKWYKVRATHQGKNYDGYVHSDYVTKGSLSRGNVNYAYLNVRKSKGTSAEKADELKKNDEVIITGSSGGWYQIYYYKNNKLKTGYVLGSYITKKK